MPIKTSICIVLLIFLIDHRTIANHARSQSRKTLDSCVNQKTGVLQRCVPNFENIAFGKSVQASSTCGTPPLEYCINSSPHKKTYQYASKNCDSCDSRKPKTIRSSKYLTDLEESNSTCWISAPADDPTKTDITLSMSFGKKFELTYISLQFCTDSKPDSLAIMKSMDFGKTWIPFQYYSSDCKAVYNRNLKAKITQANEQEALCSDTHLNSMNTNRIGFSILEGRPSFHEFDTSPILQDWVTATDIKIVINRLAAPKIQYDDLMNMHNQSRRLTDSIRSLYESTNNYAALSEISIGGRCKCNGHASRCIMGRDGKYKCDCKHNTAGLECERCLPFHYDRPWARATPRDANECLVCNCNKHSKKCRFNLELYRLSGNKSGGICTDCAHNTAGRNCHYCKSGYYRNENLPADSKDVCKACTCNSHSNKCRFNKELYLLSGRKSGGVCVNCKHNTAGRYCHYCRDGYFRNTEVTITDHLTCKECDCHLIGSINKVCNQSTGQCECKEGVMGLRCDRCQKGYQQTNSPTSPCIKITTTTTTTTTSTTTTSTTSSTLAFKTYNYFEKYPYLKNNGLSLKQVYKSEEDYNNDMDETSCEICKRKPQRVSFRDFCNYDYVFTVRILDRVEDSLDHYDALMVNYLTIIDRVYKSSKQLTSDSTNTSDAFKIEKNLNLHLWLNNNDVACKCPNIEMTKRYLIMIKSNALLSSIEYMKAQAQYDEYSNDMVQQNNDKSSNLVIDEFAFINEWKTDYIKRIRRFTRGSNRGKCA